ncbi:NB-ARC domain containing protein [Panicum miliaceum]|uniref:NB-ARC domain containing protein n=1 Tax=Panicum miliaceum TaxID=4540 RepID=A0A3L6T894_PANMI|nr:NB-ARC domain containing protein [Panicum miliaceum]
MGGVGEKIMVSALTGVMSPVLGKLTNLIEKKYSELKNLRKKLEQLREELMAINLALEKYAAVESPDVQVTAWMAEMRELAYDMEDSIDLFSHHVDYEPADTTRVKSFFDKKIRKLKKLHYCYSISHTEIDPRLQALYVEVEKLVGIEKPSQEIIVRLVDENPEERRRVVSIVGPGGSGKTTLAKQVYGKIKGQFSCVAFVSVSQKPNMNNILRELQFQTGVPRSMATGACSDQLLIDQLRSYLENKRYLVVIDDVWTKSAWETIQCALPKNAQTSRTIMTTRTNSLDGIKNEILEKCDGLPLAIVTLASLLATKPRTKEEWGRALNSISYMHEKYSGLDKMYKILSLSYNDLPNHMRNCLLQLSTFPEDHEIYKDFLVWRWIAEGFITEKQGFSLEQVAESYFYELINRNLIQPITLVPRYGMYAVEEGCRVHDIILSFPISRSAEENFATMLDNQLIMPDGFGNMESLRELGNLDGCNCSISFGEDLALLSKLRVLRVTFMSGSTTDLRTRKESLLSSLCKLGGNSLRCVHIYDNVGGGECFVDSWCPPPCRLQKFIHISKYLRFPKWINSCLCDPTYLDILVQKMEKEYLRILEDLPAIRFLYLDVKQVSDDGLFISHGAFPCLTCFQFYNIDGPGLVFEGGMPMLEWLRLVFDADKAQSTYGSLEVGIGHLSSVRRIGLTVRMIFEGENDPVEKAVKSIINGQVQMLPNCPTVDIGFSRRSRPAGRERPCKRCWII